MKILITGATGFLGSHFIAKLKETDIDFKCLVRNATNPGNKNFVQFSNYEEIPDLVQSIDPDVVFHLAAFYNYVDLPDQVPKMVESNVLLGSSILGSLRPGATFIYCGTYFQMFDTSNLLNFYTFTKEIFADIAQYFAARRGFNVCQILLSDLYGELDSRNKIISTILNAAKISTDFVPKNPNSVIYPIYISDVIKAFFDLIKTLPDSVPETIYLKPEGGFILRNLIDFVHSNLIASENKIELIRHPIPFSPNPSTVIWTTKTNFETGLLNTWRMMNLD